MPSSELRTSISPERDVQPYDDVDPFVCSNYFSEHTTGTDLDTKDAIHFTSLEVINMLSATMDDTVEYV
jgi:hypothetical protein